jgi:hypothetical protein
MNESIDYLQEVFDAFGPISARLMLYTFGPKEGSVLNTITWKK